MPDQAQEALRLVGTSFDDDLGRRVEQGVSDQHRRRVRERKLTRAGAALVLVTAAGYWGGTRAFRDPVARESTAIASRAAEARTVRFEDGSGVTLLDSGSTLQPRLITTERMVVALVSGAARFDVVPRASRRFRAEAGDVAIDVLGTAFTVDRRGKRTRVAVERGHVRVTWAGGEDHLYEGQSGTYPPESPAPAAIEPPAPEAPAAAVRAERPAPAKAAATTPVKPPATVGDPVEDLFAAADAARRARRHRDAVAVLSRIVESHAQDGRAPLAAFSLGRLLLDELRTPVEAAEAFARARALDPQGPLAEHALAREAEAWSSAGRETEARTAARAYVETYPDGSRAKSVRRWGGLE